MSSKEAAHKEDNHSTQHIIQSLLVNSVIATFKGFAAFMTASGAMFAETIHSFADCGNQGLLLLGVNQSRKPADEQHPLGYGRAAYFWSFMVAMLLFSVGGMFSVYEGIHKFHNPEPIEQIGWGLAILGFSIVLEGYSTYSNIVELNKRRGKTPFFNYLKQTKDSDLIIIFGENSAAVLGLVLALISMLISYYTGNGKYDALGSVAIGLVLIGVAIFLAVEVKALLIGESADPAIIETIKNIIKSSPEIVELINCKTIQQGPGEVLACMKIKCKPNLTFLEISTLINSVEAQLRSKAPEVKWIYIEPDFQEWK
jgi:cation diffusion facilitator family transporter